MALPLVAGACGGSPGPSVASLAATTLTTTAGASSSTTGSTQQQLIAYSSCMRQHGVTNFPDPDGSGDLPPGAKEVLRNSPAATTAEGACDGLLPSPTPADRQQEQQQDWDNDYLFAKCMRAQGVTDFPDPTAMASHPERPKFALPASYLPRRSEILATAQACVSELQLSALPDFNDVS
jgi:hypothetical protein